EEAAHYERRAETRGLLIGGLVGYFIGRRRGRIKTEKRLLPVQEKLEKQVKTLHETIADKEFQIRQLAARRHVQAKRQATQERPKPAERPPVPQPEVVPVAKTADTPSTVVEAKSRPMPETPRYVEQVPAGPMVQVAAEVAATTAAMTAAATEQIHRKQAAERLPATPPPNEAVARDAAADRVKHMSRRQLLAASEQVVISGERLSEVYESKRISEAGLRNVMMEHARGGDAEKLLKQEILNKEMSYERDPQLRKRLTSGVSAASHGLAGAGAAAGAATANLAHKAVPKVAATAERTKDIGKKVVQQAVNTGKKLDDPGKPLQQVIVRTWATVTILLAIIAIILLFR
ncbi:MAG TPA: hypothetical protein VFH39_01870, partial [Candidatus Saccharimonadales bacterium]|nr:hypothetical protein [Candidatus Saccharimonadales bacterium]